MPLISITDKEFKLLSELIEDDCGIYLGKEKRALLEGRLQNYLSQGGFTNFTEYYNHVIKDDASRYELIERITTNHTYFMREESHFYFLKNIVLPELKRKVRDKDLRIWSAASSSGEEAYTIAMMIDEFFGEEKKLWDTKILATDISKKVIKKAVEGKYAIEQIAKVPPVWKHQYFKSINKTTVEIDDRIKSEVIFREFNLMNKNYSFKKKFHIIFCRNVMIYFDESTKDQLIERMYESLDDGGYLFIGHSETINKEKTRFKYICPAVYKK